MSSRTYLFTAIACVMLAIAAGQWAMFHFLSQDIAKQVREQSKDLSKELAVFAADAMNIEARGNVFKSVVEQGNGERHAEINVEVSEQAADFSPDKQVPTKDAQNKILKKHVITIDAKGEVTHDYNISIGSNKGSDDKPHQDKSDRVSSTEDAASDDIDYEIIEDKVIKADEAGQPKIIKKITQNKFRGEDGELRIETISKLVRSQIEATELHFDSKQDMQSVWVFHSSSKDGGAASKRIEIKDNTNMLLDQLKHMGLMIMVTSWLLGIGFIYWISHQFTAPLRALDAGYQKLSDGDTQVSVPVKGTSEIQQAIQGFNQMTKKLAFFHQQQQEINDKMHLAEIGEVSRGIAHALRNPLHTIGLALDKVFGLSPSSYESGIRQKLKLMDKTIQALLNLSVNGVERTDSIAIKPIIQDIVMEMQLTEGVDVAFELDIEPNLQLVGSEADIRNMLHTLIVNAVEASPLQSKVIIKASRNAEKQLLVSVEDQGDGVSKDVMSSLFEPHITTKAEGAGMGLYIAIRLAQLMYSGDIQLKNKESIGGTDAHGCIATLQLCDANKPSALGDIVSGQSSADKTENQG
jgi:signal transduction histidine kinase